MGSQYDSNVTENNNIMFFSVVWLQMLRICLNYWKCIVFLVTFETNSWFLDSQLFGVFSPLNDPSRSSAGFWSPFPLLGGHADSFNTLSDHFGLGGRMLRPEWLLCNLHYVSFIIPSPILQPVILYWWHWQLANRLFHQETTNRSMSDSPH